MDPLFSQYKNALDNKRGQILQDFVACHKLHQWIRDDFTRALDAKDADRCAFLLDHFRLDGINIFILKFAVEIGHLEMTRLVLEYDFPKENNIDVLKTALDLQHWEIAKLIYLHPATPPSVALRILIQGQHWNMIDWCILFCRMPFSLLIATLIKTEMTQGLEILLSKSAVDPFVVYHIAICERKKDFLPLISQHPRFRKQVVKIGLGRAFDNSSDAMVKIYLERDPIASLHQLIDTSNQNIMDRLSMIIAPNTDILNLLLEYRY